MSGTEAWDVLRAVAPQVAPDEPALQRARADLDRRIRAERRQPRWGRWALAAGVAAATTVALVVWPSADQDAFASWVATPTPASTAQVDAAQAQCDTALNRATEQLADTQREFGVHLLDAPSSVAELAGRSTLLSEQRGDVTFVLSTNDAWTVGCLAAPGISPALTEATTAEVSLRAALLAADEIDVLGTADEGDGQGTSAALVYGRAGGQVAGVQLTTSGGVVVSATVGDGYWSAWWPSTGKDGAAADVRVALRDGTFREAGALGQLGSGSTATP